jgi:hypothetical protein
MATGVASWSTTAASNSTADSNVNWAEGQAPSSVNDSARAMMASVAKYRDDTEGTLTTGGTSTAYTVTTGQGFASLSALDGNKLTLRFNATNGASPTLAVDGLAAKAINTDVSTAVATGAILANSVHTVTYDNTNNCFLLHDALKLVSTALTTVDITGATAETSPAVADEVPIYDASASANRKMTLANLLKVIASLSAETAPATDDELAIYDTSGSATDKITLANLLKVVDALTEDTSPDESADFLLSYDTSATAAKKVKPDNIVPKAANGASMVLIETQQAVSSATIDFDAGLDDTYDAYEVRLSNVKPATDDAQLRLRVGTGAGPTYDTTGYRWRALVTLDGGNIETGSSNDSAIGLSGGSGNGIGNATGENFSGVITFANPDATDFLQFEFHGSYSESDGQSAGVHGGGRRDTAGAVTGIRFFMSSGDIASGRFSLYGLKKS